jgi:hypothetical protein
MHSYANLRTGCGLTRGVLTTMRLLALLFTATLLASPATAQPQPSSSRPGSEGTKEPQATKEEELKLPVSIARIRDALATTPLLSLSTIDERPLFRIQIQERQRLEELLATLNFKAGPVPAGGIYMAEQNRIMFPSVDNPLRQPLAAFNQPELLTILIENLVGHYLGGKAINAISKAERASAEAAAKEEVRAAVAQYCSAQPNSGGGIQICDSPVR